MPLELRTFRYRELQRATQNFKDPDMVLGEGGFGKVFKGWLKDPSVGPDQFPVAVKRLNPNSVQGQREWLVQNSIPPTHPTHPSHPTLPTPSPFFTCCVCTG